MNKSDKTPTKDVYLLSVYGEHRPGEVITLPEAEADGLIAAKFAKVPDVAAKRIDGTAVLAEMERSKAEAESTLSSLRKKVLALDPSADGLPQAVFDLQVAIDPTRAKPLLAATGDQKPEAKDGKDGGGKDKDAKDNKDKDNKGKQA